VSALFGIFTDSVIVAWPLDLILWVVLGFAVARFAQDRSRSLWGPLLGLLAFFLVYGLVLSQLVELA
jgi:hypothetical protein